MINFKTEKNGEFVKTRVNGENGEFVETQAKEKTGSV